MANKAVSKFIRTANGRVLLLDEDDTVINSLDPTTTQLARSPRSENSIILGFTGDAANQFDKIEVAQPSVTVPTSTDRDDLLEKLANDFFYDEVINQLINITGGDDFDNKLLQVDCDSVVGTTFLGYAASGSLTSGAVWAVKKIVETGSNYSITWADGNKNFDNVWNDRLTLSYS